MGKQKSQIVKKTLKKKSKQKEIDFSDIKFKKL